MIHKYNYKTFTTKLKIKSLLLLMMLASLGSSSFTFAQVNPGLDPVLTLSSTKVTLFSAANSTQDVTVTSNIAWTVTSIPYWLTINQASGSNNGTITFKAQANTGAARIAYVTVHANGVEDQIITVTQLPEIPSFKFTSSSQGTLYISLQFNSSGSFYIDWGDGTQRLQTASMSLTDYTSPASPAYIAGDTVKIYGMGITNITINSQGLTSLDIKQCVDLTTLDVQRNTLNVLDVSSNTKLTSLVVAYNSLSELNVRNNTQLSVLSVSYNNLSLLDVSNNPGLTNLSCSSNRINSLDVSNNTGLTKLYCASNYLNFNTLPRQKSYAAYYYTPQGLCPVSANGNIVDLHYLDSVPDINNIPRNTVYKWYTKTTGTLLASGTDYTEIKGKFTFKKILTDSVYCIMTNAAFPNLTGASALRTENLKVELLLPIVTTTPVNIADVTPTTAVVNGEIVNLGVPDATEYGICWNTTGTPSPTILDSYLDNSGQPVMSGGNFSKNMASLTPNTTYYVRAYATNLAGTGYGKVETFTTGGLPPVVTTDSIPKIGITKATAYGNITGLGIPNPTEYGVVWSTSTTPTVALSTKTSQGPTITTGSFNSDITGLSATTTYHVRAYATNSVGTSYGQELTFTTLTPSISDPVPASLGGFSTTVGTASASQTFTIGGMLSQILVISAPANFEVSKNGVAFSSSISLTPSPSEIVADSTIEVRIASTAPLGAVSGDVVCSSLGVISKNVAVEGIVKPIQLTISDPAITLSKTYDGTTQAGFTAGALTPILPGDNVSLDVTTAATYLDSNVGKNKSITVHYILTGTEANKYLPPADYIIYTGEITGKPLTASNPTIATPRVYDGTPVAAVTPGTLTGVEAADVANVTLEAGALFDNANIGANKTITVAYTLSGSAAGNYIAPLNYVIITGEITGKQLTVSDPMLTLSKEYNGNSLATVTPGALSGIEMPDMSNVIVEAAASYDNAKAGSGKTITVVYTLSGSAAGNYLAPVNYIATNGEITGKPLTVSDPVITLSKPYDGNTLAVVTPGTLSGVEAADVGNVVLAATASYDNSNAGSSKAIKVVYTLTGTEAYNYLPPADYIINTGEITGKLLTASNPTITTPRVYDGTPVAAVVPGTLTGVLAADVANVTLEAGALFDNANIGTNKTITVTYSLSGFAAGNYIAPSNYVIITGEITGKQLTVSDPTLETKKVYDGNSIATVTPSTLSGVELPDMANVIVAATASYDNAKAGSSKTITVIYTLSGSAAGNYLAPVNYIATNGEITGKPLTASDPAITLSKPYDGNTQAVVTTGALSGVEAADVGNVVLAATASYDNSNAGSSKAIKVVYTLTGTEAYNYLPPADYIINTGEITGKLLTASNPTITTPRVYDGTPVAAVVPGTLTGVLAADVANVTLEAGALYDNAYAGTGKTITVTYSLSGSAAGNYIAPSNYVIITGVITGKQLTVSDPMLTISKVYDGNFLATVTPGALSGMEMPDMSNVIVEATASYDNAKAGTGKTITVIYTLSGSAAGNYLAPVNYVATNGEITGKPLTASDPAITTSKIYNGNTQAAVTPGTLSGVEAADVGNVVLAATASYDNIGVGSGKTITVTYTLSGTEAYKYLPPADYIITTGEITGKPLTASNPTITTSRVYNGTLETTVTPGILTGVDVGDDVILNATATYDNATVGKSKTITVTYMLTGLSANIYATPAAYTINSGEITAKSITASIPSIDVVKVYDGSLVATVVPGTLTSVEVSDMATVFLEATASYDNANVGTGKTIKVVYTLSGSAAGNYSVPLDYTVANGEIKVKPLIASDPIITTLKVYDGSLVATVTPGTLSGVEPVDMGNVSLQASASYDNINVGTGKTITVIYTLIGSAAGNYAAPSTYIITNGEIDGKPLILSAPIITTLKVYNGTPAATVTLGTFTGVDAGDDVILNATATYDNANAGIGKAITVNYTLTGLSAGIYAVPADYTVNSGEIDPKPLTVSVPTVTVLKIYDGTPVADVSVGTLSGVEAGDVAYIALSATASYDNANKGSGKPITVTYALTGSAIGNYLAPSDYILTNGEITVKSLTVSDPIITAAKVYDGSSVATVIPGTLSGVEVVDAVNVVLTATGSYDNANTGSGKSITVTYALTGSAAGNYTVPSDFVIMTAEITPKPLTSSDPTITTSKIYDGSLVANVVTGTLSGVEPADVANVVLSATALYDNERVGTGKTIEVTYTLSGSASANYTAPSAYTVMNGVIAGKPLTVSAPMITSLKGYDGTPVATVSAGTLSGVDAGDDVSLNAIATYDNSNAGTGKTITVTYSLSGANAAIYAAPANDVVINGEIDAKPLTATNAEVIVSKVYDGKIKAAVTPGNLIGVVTGDDVILNATATYDNAVPGTDKTITVAYSLTGSSAGNYTAPSNYIVTNGEITVKPLLIPLNMTFTLIKTYDGSTSVTVIPGVLTGVETGDDVTLNVMANYDNANAGTGKTITVTFSLSGADAGKYVAPANYTINTGEISPHSLSITNPAIATTKEYDGTTSVVYTPGSLTGVNVADVPNVTLTSIASYDNANAGTGKTITVTYGLTGSQAGNYAVPPAYTITIGVITPKPLVVVSLKITTSKLYDSTSSATFTVGNLAGIVPLDAGNVVLAGTAVYDNANAGTGKNITVSYTLSGSAIANYTVPSSYTITNGVIIAKQLTIADPVVVINKMVDGNTSAVITTLGLIQGVEATDGGNVNFTAAANYNNPNVGINKTVKVVYTLSGSAMGNYIAPVDFIITGAKISDNVILSPIVTPTNGCEGFAVDLDYTVVSGTPTQYKITFDAATLAAGILDVSYTNLPSSSATGVLPINIPTGTKDGIYHGTLQFRNELGVESPVYTFQFTVNVSTDYIIPKFDDVVLIDNSSNRFVAYQWYKDGVELQGATKQFYNDLGGLVGSYSAKLTTVDGQTLYTCSKVLETSLVKKVSVFPSPVKKYQASTVKVTGLKDEELAGAELSVYTLQGICVYHTTTVQKENSISLPPIVGIYVGHVTTSGGQKLPFKVIVIE